MESTTIESVPTSLEGYRSMELHAVSDLRRLRDIAERLELEPSVIKLVDDVLTRNKKHKFSIAVVGEFKRGKSTFINALLGKEILPSDIIPCSATLNRITYNLTPSAKIIFKAKGQQKERVEEIEIDELADYVTKLTPEAEQTAADVKEAIVYYPVPYCKNNVDIIDTPGLNDDEAMTNVTLGVLPHASAAIFVIMATAPFGMVEADFLHNKLLLSEMGRVIFIVNAIDLIRRKRDRKRILETIRTRIKTSVEKRLAEQFGQDSEDYRIYRKRIGEPRVFGVSSLDALEGKIDKDDAMLAGSGFLEFEEALDKFLTETRGAVELQVLANRTVATSDEILKKLNIEASALQMSQSDFEESYHNTSAQLEGLRQRREEELRQLEQSSQRTKQRVLPLLDQLEEELKAAANEVIEDLHIKPQDLHSNNIEGLLAKLGSKVSEAVQNKGKRVGEKIQIEIERDLLKEAERLRDFTIIVGQTLHNIELQFTEVEADSSIKRSAGAESAAAALAVYTGFGGIWSGYREAGVKGAGVGGVASLGTFFGAAVILTVIGLPATFPIAVAVSVLSIFTGQVATRAVFGGNRVEQFKQNYKEKVFERLALQLKSQPLDLEINESVDMAYGALKEKVIGEVDASIEQIQSTLDKLRKQKARDEVLTERRRQEISEIRTEVQTIRSHAHRLSEQLIEITSV